MDRDLLWEQLGVLPTPIEDMPDRADLLERLRRAGLSERLIVGGSSALLALPTRVPALTRDLDLIVEAEWLAQAEDEVRAAHSRRP